MTTSPSTCRRLLAGIGRRHSRGRRSLPRSRVGSPGLEPALARVLHRAATGQRLGAEAGDGEREILPGVGCARAVIRRPPGRRRAGGGSARGRLRFSVPSACAGSANPRGDAFDDFRSFSVEGTRRCSPGADGLDRRLSHEPSTRRALVRTRTATERSGLATASSRTRADVRCWLSNSARADYLSIPRPRKICGIQTSTPRMPTAGSGRFSILQARRTHRAYERGTVVRTLLRGTIHPVARGTIRCCRAIRAPLQAGAKGRTAPTRRPHALVARVRRRSRPT